MAYTFTSDFGGGVILAPCLQTLCAEIARKYPNAVNLGEIGDTKHQAEGFGSDHNPFIRHNNTRYVRAIDIGGDESIQQALFNFVQQLYERRDPRVFPFGYVHKDGVITTWFGHGTHADAGDDGHLHISVTQHDGNNPSPDGWVPALDSRAPWGLVNGTTPQVITRPASHVPPWPLPPGNYFGLISGPDESHGGFFANERPPIKLIQQRLQAMGYAPKTPSWADGTFGPQTGDAVAKWQHAKWAKQTTRYGEVWSDDWQRLFA
jgi:hypothetical protein